MPTIHDLSQTSALDGGDEVAIYSPPNSATRKATLDQVAVCVRDLINGEPDDTIYSVSTDAIVVQVATPGGSVWVLLTLTATAASGTIILPTADARAHGQEVLVTCTQTITTLAFNGSGAALIGAPTTVGPTAPFRLKFDLISLTWYKV